MIAFGLTGLCLGLIFIAGSVAVSKFIDGELGFGVSTVGVVLAAFSGIYVLGTLLYRLFTSLGVG